MQESRLARLPGRMDKEVLLGFYKMVNLIKHTPKGLHHIVILRITQARRIEKSLHKVKLSNIQQPHAFAPTPIEARQLSFRRPFRNWKAVWVFYLPL